jgi:hypothetical protein
MSIQACMGGWCRRRTGCEHYVNPTSRKTAEPAENLCRRQAADVFVPLSAVRAGVPA